MSSMEHAAHGSHAHAHVHDDVSQWPMVSGIGLFLTFLGFATGLGLKDFPYSKPLWIIGSIISVVGLVGWWFTLVKNSQANPHTKAHAHDFNEDAGLKIGFSLFIASEVMFFAAFFAYFFYIKAYLPEWPPEGAPHALASNEMKYLLIPGLNTLILIVSGIFYNWAESNIIKGNRALAKIGMFATVALGVLFLYLQFAVEWAELIHEGFVWDTTKGAVNHLASAFYMLTGFHGMHVFVGAVFIAVILARVLSGHFDKKHHFAMQAAGWYWHFVDVVWIFLFTVIYAWK